MKIIGINQKGREVLIATGKRAEALAADIGLSDKGMKEACSASKNLFAGMQLIWEDDNGRRSNHLEKKA